MSSTLHGSGATFCALTLALTALLSGCQVSGEEGSRDLLGGADLLAQTNCGEPYEDGGVSDAGSGEPGPSCGDVSCAPTQFCDRSEPAVPVCRGLVSVWAGATDMESEGTLLLMFSENDQPALNGSTWH